MFYLVAALVAFATPMASEEPSSEGKEGARVVAYYGYTEAVELKSRSVRAVLCPQAGGRVLEFSIEGKNALYLDELEKSWQPGRQTPISAGRFDYGPELTVAPHPAIWSGRWSAEITGPCSARLASPRDPMAGIQLIRDFALEALDQGVPRETQRDVSIRTRLSCKQTIINISNETREVCHWGRSFSPGGGICLVPLGEQPSRFPGKYAMYEESAVINVRNTDDRIRERDGFLEILAPPRKPKLGFDSYAGWLGYLMPNDLLFVKRFKTHPNRVYNEAAGLTLSVWYPQGPRIELEPIGPRERLQRGERASFTEEWWLLSYPFPKNEQPIDLKRLSEQVAKQTIEAK